MRKLNEQNIRKISKVAGGKTFSITLPIEIIRTLGWKEKQKVMVELKGKTVMIKDWKNNKIDKKK